MQRDRSTSEVARDLRGTVLTAVQDYFAAAFRDEPFVHGLDPVPVAQKTIDVADLVALIDAALDMHLTGGRYQEKFEHDFAKWFGVRECVFTNSGSSANLLALSALTSPALGDRRILPGDEVITAAAGFPTTVNPIVQIGAVPVFIDSELRTYNADLGQLERALSPRTRAVILAHTLGNPFDEIRVRDFCDKAGIWFVADCCDALGARWNHQQVGRIADLATASFYPAHHITTGEGGAVLTKSPRLRKIVESFRDWGRDCWCPTACENTCGKRFEQQHGQLPAGYDHKYTYTHVGYNLKATDMQAALGCSQLQKLDGFIKKRKENANRLWSQVSHLTYLELPDLNDECSWFGMPIRVLPGYPIDRNGLVRHLEDRKIATRLLFAGNLTRQPAYEHVNYHAFGPLDNADIIMRDVFWVGVHPGLGFDEIDFIAETIASAARELVA